MKKKLLLILGIIIFLGCAEESPDLVNPPAINNTINLRFINLGGTGQDLTLEMLNDTKLENIPYNQSTLSINPPADSTTLEVLQNGALAYDYNRIYKFRIRKVKYTFIALPTHENGFDYQEVDTLLNFRTALTVPQNRNDCLVRLFNAFPDSTVTYSLRLGCPNGAPVSTAMPYKRVNSQAAIVPSGKQAFSLVRSKGGQNEIINLYEAELEPQGQYTFLVTKDSDGNEKMMFLDENDLDATAYRPATIIEERLANMRTVNLSGAPVNIYRSNGDVLMLDVDHNYIDIYKGIVTCASEDLDTLIVDNNIGQDTISASLEVLQDYTIAAFNSNSGLKSILIEPVPNTFEAEGKATIRVVNGAEDIDGITVSVGARNSPISEQNNNNFVIGELLTTQLNYGSVSEAEYLEPPVLGQAFKLPITIFTSTEPADLLYTTIAEIEPDKEYLLFVNQDEQNNIETYLVQHNEEEQQPNQLEEGVMLQVLHAVPGLDEMLFSVNDQYLNNARLFFTGSLSTVIPSGDQTLYINGINYNFQADPEKRPYVIACGNSESVDIFDLNFEPMGAVYGEFKRRFVNASEDVPTLGIKEQEADTIPPAYFVDYKLATAVETKNLDNKQAFYFSDFNTNEELLRVGDINPSYGKNYYYIFAGKKEVGDGFTMIIMQEF